MTRVLALSPHLDDAVFSAGGTLARLAAAGAQVTVATVFTATVPDPDPRGFALACQLDKGLGPEVDYMALRRAEDGRACARIGAAPRHLPFREGPHRGYASAAELFAGMREDDTVVEAVTPALRALVDALAPALILAPQAIGAHVDHVAVVRALDAAAPDSPVAWWRDHPYTIRTGTPAEPYGDHFLALPEHEVALDARSHAAKVEAAMAYASQLGFQFGGAQAARGVFAGAARIERLRGSARAGDTLRRLLETEA